MNAVRCTYIICELIETLALLGLAVFGPIWITPGNYLLSIFAFALIVIGGGAYTERLNSWEGMGKV